MAIPLPIPWLPGADTENSLADGVQQNFDALRVAVGTVAAQRPAVVTALPGAPVDGQENPLFGRRYQRHHLAHEVPVCVTEHT